MMSFRVPQAIKTIKHANKKSHQKIREIQVRETRVEMHKVLVEDLKYADILTGIFNIYDSDTSLQMVYTGTNERIHVIPQKIK